MALYNRLKLSYTEVVTFLKLGYQLRASHWMDKNTRLEFNTVVIPGMELHDAKGRKPSTDIPKVIDNVTDWEIYKIGTLDSDEAKRLSTFGVQIGRYDWVHNFGWLNRINTTNTDGMMATADIDFQKITPEDLNAVDWFVPLTKYNQKILDIEITNSMIAVYEKYVKLLVDIAVDTPKAKPTLTMPIDFNSAASGLIGYAIKEAMDSSLPFTKHPDTAVESILSDNTLHIANLKTMVISTNLIDRLLRHMRDNNISVEELASHMNVTKEALLDTVHRPNNISIRQLVDIADAINFDLDVIFK